MKKYPFYAAYTQARELYGVELAPDEFETVGLIAWDRIGNKDIKLYKYQTTPEKNDLGEYYIELPCNLDIIEAVTADYEDYQKTSPTSIFPINNNGWIEDYSESRKFNTNHFYSKGKYIKYIQEGNIIKLSEKFDTVTILYKGVYVDDEGLPELTESEIDAIAAFCAYTHDFKQARMTKDQATFQMAQIMEQKWKRKCNQARIPDSLSQNDLDEILNVSASWDRKRFGKSYKPIK